MHIFIHTSLLLFYYILYIIYIKRNVKKPKNSIERIANLITDLI